MFTFRSVIPKINFSIVLSSIVLLIASSSLYAKDASEVYKKVTKDISLVIHDTRDCGAGYVPDCADSDCCPAYWIGDGFEDCEEQAFGCDLTCYDNDGGDCDEAADDGGDTGGSEACSDCEFDFTPYGSECCDSAWDDFGINCADLEANYNWDCSGCTCPGDE